MRIELVRASQKDLELVLDILNESATWMRSTLGILDQWPERFPGRIFSEAIALGEIYLIWLEGECVGTRRIQTSDVEVWGEDDGLALYCHSLAIRRRHKGRGISEAVYTAVHEMGLQMGRPLIRLDCLASNAGLRAHYERLGFEQRGEVMQSSPVGTWTSMRYER